MSLTKERKSSGIQIIEIGILLMITNFMTAIFLWQSILNGWKISEGGRFFFYALVQREGANVFLGIDQAGSYIGILSIIFSFLGNREELVLIGNLIFQLLGVFFFFSGVKTVLNSISACIFSVLSALCSVAVFDVTADVPMHFTWCALAFSFFIFSKVICSINEEHRFWKMFFLIIVGVLGGFLVFYDISGIFILACVSMFRLTIEAGSANSKAKDLLYIIPVSVITFLVLIFYYFSASQPLLFGLYQWYEKRMAYYADSEMMWKQFVAIGLLFFLYLCINLIFLLKRYNNKSSEVIEIAGTQPVPECQNTEQTINVVEELRIPDKSVELMKELAAPKTKEMVLETKILEKISVDLEPGDFEKTEEVSDPKPLEQEVTDIQEQVPAQIKLLDNPLPLPKKHVKKVMNYAFEPSKEQMHYDLNNYNVDDDYDLK
ncbi:MAG: hypothetical protein IKW28_06895 [Lachnospiraceae bacterium]|nr:hypothetical protein [Lachnospiraceae bacterium]